MTTINAMFFELVLTAASPATVAMPNVGFDPGALSTYYEVFLVPGRKSAMDMDSTNIQRGFCQVSCFVREKIGEVKAVTMAEKIITAFPRGTKFSSNGLAVEIVQPAYYSQGFLTDNGWYVVPVTIPYTSFNF